MNDIIQSFDDRRGVGHFFAGNPCKPCISILINYKILAENSIYVYTRTREKILIWDKKLKINGVIKYL